jgi:hypothetical protein
MNITFENTALKELYTTGGTQGHQYKTSIAFSSIVLPMKMGLSLTH